MAADPTAVSLVSKCSSVDEFVAAFRPYVHRDHVFVPTTGLMETGRKGRIAITLADGTAVLSGEAEVLSASAVPQGPYQKPGVRLRFVRVDDAARALMDQLEKGKEPPVAGDADTAPSGARADIVAIGSGTDLTERAMCTLVDTPTPGAAPMPKPVAKPIIPAAAKQSLAGGVPGKSFKIPSIPGPAKGLTPAPVPAPGAVLREAMDAASGDLTVPTDPSFKEPSMPIESSIVVQPQPGGKARNRANTPLARKAAGSPPPETASIGPPEGVHKFKQTLLGVPAIAFTTPAPAPAPKPEPPKPEPPKPEPVATSSVDDWTAPEDEIGDATEQTALPEEESSGTPTASPSAPTMQAVPVAASEATTRRAGTPPPVPSGPPPTPASPVVPPPVLPTARAPGGKAAVVAASSAAPLRSGPSAPTMRTPQSMLELAATMDAQGQAPAPAPARARLPGVTPPPGPPPAGDAQAQAQVMMIPAYPPGMAPPSGAEEPLVEFTPISYAAAAIPQPVERQDEQTEVVVRRDRDGTDEVFLRRSKRRPLIIGAVAAGVVLLGVVLGVVIASSGSKKSKPKSDDQTETAQSAKPALPPDAGPARPVAVETADAAPAAVEEPAAAIDAGAAAPPSEPEPPTPTKPPAGQCKVAFATTPPGATIQIGGKKKGKTPVTLDLPCKKATAVFTRERYEKETKAFAPKEGATVKVSARLSRPTFAVRIISSPGGASVSVQGRSAGKTPANVKIPGYEAVPVKVSKPGYQSKTTKVTVKRSGTVVNVTLRRGN